MVPRERAVLAVLLLFAAQVTMATGETRCKPGEYEVNGLCRSSKLCPAGHYVREYVDQDHSIRECRECESGTFRAHPSEESSCMPCSQCREADQEVVTECFPTSDRLCQCKQGSFYCDSKHCTESCFRCKRCEDSTILQPCNATRDTVCAVKIHPEAGNLNWLWIPLAVATGLSIAVAIITVTFCHYRRRAAWFFQSVVGFVKQNPKEPGSPSPRSSQPKEMQMPIDLERGQPAPGVETRPLSEVEDSALAPKARTRLGPSKDAGEIFELQELGAKGSPAAPEQTLQQTQAPEAPRPPGQAEVSPSLRSLEQAGSRRSRCRQGHFPPRALRENLVQASPSFWWFPAICEVPWLGEASPHLCLHLHVAFSLCEGNLTLPTCEWLQERRN
ncbi:tumor necrosis factor receptor superfamily member 14-like isoform X1 [Balaenoptera ricei]|uniref:tumor necrosis factor receptor superfamily member 14-like isoform X1 n=1 Tax=Balaenoptera ricei TaxID=2746895 RepID=UPI0028BD9793|nr:tumor necrosis factor receptor superfamily member 14-like isoform X1 [Balaenoptera ricei]